MSARAQALTASARRYDAAGTVLIAQLSLALRAFLSEMQAEARMRMRELQDRKCTKRHLLQELRPR